MLLMRPLIEASLFQFSARSKFDPENIGGMFNATIKSNACLGNIKSGSQEESHKA